MLPQLAALPPNAAILLLTLGLALIAVELNRPGSILPGMLGLLLALLSAASLYSHHPAADAALEGALCIALLILVGWKSWSRLQWIVAVAATIALIHAIDGLLPPIPGPRISAWAAILSGLLFGIGTTVLTRIARRARRNKGLD